MLGTWKIISKISAKQFNVKCELCGFETQRVASKLKTHHRCPSIIDGTKYCYKCQQRKTLDFFHADRTVPGGYSKVCKECYAERVNVVYYNYKPVKRRKQCTNKRSTKLSDVENFLKHRQNTLKYRHKNKSFKPYNLPDGYLIEQFKNQEGKCYYTGYPLNHKETFSANSISVDRLYPEEGYTVGNVVLCTHSINAMKLTMNVDEFKVYLQSIIDGVNKFLLT
jgi:hypothetical protein